MLPKLIPWMHEKLEREQKLANYAATRYWQTGTEKYYESLLHGKVGYQEVEVNVVELFAL